MKNRKLPQAIKYEYLLPKDGARLAIDASVSGAIAAIQDGPKSYTPTEMDIRALAVCEQMKQATKHLTNDYYEFCQIYRENFVKNYAIKQEMFKHKETSHKVHMQDIKRMGGWKAAFEQARKIVIDTIEERIV